MERWCVREVHTYVYAPSASSAMDGTVHNQIHPTWLPALTDPVRLTILLSLTETLRMTVVEFGETCYLGERALRRQLNSLVEAGLVEEHPGYRDGFTPGRPATHFALAPEIRERLQPLLEILAAPLRPSR